MKKINVCIIDGSTVAQLSKIISEEQCFDVCIIEEHPYAVVSKMKGIAVCRDIIAYQIKVSNIYTCLMPTISNIKLSSFLGWYRLWKIKKMVYKVFDDIGVDLSSCRVYGAITSTIMNFLPDCTDVVPLDHGVECVARYAGTYNNYTPWTIKKRKVLQYFTGFYSLRWRNTIRGYTFANCKNDWFININYKKFKNDYFEGLINTANTFYKKKNIALVLLETQGGYERAMRMNNRAQYIRKLEYDRLFRSMIKKLDGIDEVLVKFHPYIHVAYQHEVTEVLSLLKNVCMKNGLRCLDITELYGSVIAPYIPAEFYVNYLPVKVIVSTMSTAVFNISSMDSSVRMICYSDFLDKLYDECTNNIDDINPYVENVRFYGDYK